MKKQKLTPEQRAEHRLWTNADKACRKLMESLRTDVRIGYLTFNVREGITAHLSFKVEVATASTLTTTGKKGKKQAWTWAPK